MHGYPGQLAQVVEPNSKCEGCMHYEPNQARSGLCMIGLRPWLCGDGNAQQVGYAPIAAQREVTADAQAVAGVAEIPTEPGVPIVTVSLDSLHEELVAEIVGNLEPVYKSSCRLHKSSVMAGPYNPGAYIPTECACRTLPDTVVAKALLDALAPRYRTTVSLDEATAFVARVRSTR